MATRAVPKEEVEALSAKHNACVFETSAKVGTEKKAHLDRRMWWCFQVSSEGGQGCRGFLCLSCSVSLFYVALCRLAPALQTSSCVWSSTSTAAAAPLLLTRTASRK